ncbi:transcriptional regulator, LacI family [Acidimicrobium ferrooxidans DSM 10331]|uniref:Transcriptional regulator, LacI family n=1 Tax=Acidimicrobium ferrooxidans (strain DSM 10331 / JCM 15462 / NBRC 103882 / ICP) TaxID=525909 RepID=C7LZV0_ACIFD|nr:LacI family DNA-binding transcriptional regulator [Acidimicrobium ferrooxidans]ACU54258.1 transcriptional regulator, LacI family [Acidimicrobium ferrooxidans DSM 10331]
MTIRDVARQAGVGIATVSRVVNGSGPVADVTRRHVEDAIRDLGFRPSRAARSLRRRESNVVGVLVSGVTQASVVERVRGLIKALAPLGLDPVLVDVADPHQRERALAVLVGEGVADAIVAISIEVPDAWSSRLRERGGLVVSVDHDAPGWPSVVIDNVLGGRLAASHLVSLGHERIGFVGDRPAVGMGFSASAERERGVRQVLNEAGLTLRRAWVRHPPFGVAEAAASVRSLLASGSPPTAVSVASDVQAMGVLRTAAELGLRVPDDLSIVGFDDIELAEVIGLTTVRQPLEGSGAWAAGVLAAWLHGEPVDGGRVWLPLEVIVRGTTGPVRRQVSPDESSGLSADRRVRGDRNGNRRGGAGVQTAPRRAVTSGSRT